MDGRTLVEGVYEAATRRDLPGLVAQFHPEAELEAPFAGAGARHHDRQSMDRLFGFLLKSFDALEFEILEVHQTSEADRLIVEVRSRFQAGGDITYENEYVVFCRFRDGLIVHWKEYANPVPFERVLGVIQRNGASK